MYIQLIVRGINSSVEVFLPIKQLESEGFQQQMIAGRIYDYITNFWVSPYVTIDEILARGDGTRPRPYPMSGEKT